MHTEASGLSPLVPEHAPGKNDRSLAELESDFAAVARAAALGGSPATTLTTLLHIGAEHAVVLSGHGETPEIVRRLDVGASRIAGAFFHHDSPMSHEIERAVDLVEDEVMQLRRAADANATLVSPDPGLREWGAVGEVDRGCPSSSSAGG